MARGGLMTALQAALAGVSGGAAGYARYQEQERKRMLEDEERKRRDAIDLITYGERAVEPGPLATRVPAGGPGAVAGRAAQAPMPGSAIPMPTSRVDFGEAQQALEREEATPSGTTPVQIGGQTLYIPVGQRARDIRRAEEASAEEADLERTLRREGAVGELRKKQSTEAAIEAERTAFNALKRFKQVSGAFDPSYGQYAADLEDYRAIRRTNATRAPSGGGSTLAQRIEAQVLDEVARRSALGKEVPNPAWSVANMDAPKTIRVAYKPDEIAKLASDIRTGLTAAFSAGTPAAPPAGTPAAAPGRAGAPATPPSRGTAGASPEAPAARDLFSFEAFQRQDSAPARLDTARMAERQMTPRLDTTSRSRGDTSAAAPAAGTTPTPRAPSRQAATREASEDAIAALNDPARLAQSIAALRSRGTVEDAAARSSAAARAGRPARQSAARPRAAGGNIGAILDAASDDTLPLFDRRGGRAALELPPMGGPSPTNPLGFLPFDGEEISRSRSLPLREQGTDPINPYRQEQIRTKLESRYAELGDLLQRSGPRSPRYRSLIAERDAIRKALVEYFGAF